MAIANSQTQQTNSPVWVTVNEAMRLAGFRRTRLYELMADGTLKSIKIGGKRLISFRSIEKLGCSDA